MRAISLFSGVGGMDRGLERAGIRTVLQVERDPWCLSVLEHHWPDTERLTDVRDVGANTTHAGTHDRTGRTRQPDLVHGGFPCQDLSVAGQRAGLGGERSGLWFEFQRVLRELRPRWTLIENVPGLLSSAGGRDFGTLLAGLDECGFHVAWAVLDAQHFGVPQRRRRVFIVGGPSQRACEQVLAVCEGCGGHPATGREARERVAAGGPSSPDDAGVFSTSGRGWWNEGAGSLRADAGGMEQSGHLVARSLTAREIGYRMDAETENFLVASSQRASDGHHGHSSPRGDGADNLIPIDLRQSSRGERLTNNRAHGSGGAPGTGVGEAGGPAFTVTERGQALAGTFGVRRLTPLECERLMSWPDDWTRWTADGREIPDSHRYRMCGNGVVSTVAEWIGHRMMRLA